MNLSFFTVTILYTSLILFIHYKIKETEKNMAPTIKKSRNYKRAPVRNEIKTVISLDNIDEDVENDTIRDLKKFLETPDIKAKKIVAPIISELDLNEYFNDGVDSEEEDEADSVSDEESTQEPINNQELEDLPELSQKGPLNETPNSGLNELQGFNGLAAFDEFGGYQNFATL